MEDKIMLFDDWVHKYFNNQRAASRCLTEKGKGWYGGLYPTDIGQIKLKPMYSNIEPGYQPDKVYGLLPKGYRVIDLSFYMNIGARIYVGCEQPNILLKETAKKIESYENQIHKLFHKIIEATLSEPEPPAPLPPPIIDTITSTTAKT